MDCQKVQDFLNGLHFVAGFKGSDENAMMSALNHVMGCGDCKPWVLQEIWQKVKEKHDKGELGEDAYMGHGMLHDGVLNTDCVAFS